MQNNSTKKRISTSVLVKASLLATISIVLTRFLSPMILLGGIPALRIGFGSIPLIMSGMMFGPVIGAITGVVADLAGVLINPQGSFFPGFTLSSALYGVISGLLYQNLKIHKLKINFNLINALVMVVFALAMFGYMFAEEIIIFENGLPIANDPYALPVSVMIIVAALIFIFMPFVFGKWFKDHETGVRYDKIAFNVNVTYVIISLLLNTLWLSMMFDKGFMLLLPGRIIAAIAIIPIYTIIIYTLGRYINLTENK